MDENHELILPTKTEVEHQIVGGIVSSGGGGVAGDEHDDENGDQVETPYIYKYIISLSLTTLDCVCFCEAGKRKEEPTYITLVVNSLTKGKCFGNEKNNVFIHITGFHEHFEIAKQI